MVLLIILGVHGGPPPHPGRSAERGPAQAPISAADRNLNLESEYKKDPTVPLQAIARRTKPTRPLDTNAGTCRSGTGPEEGQQVKGKEIYTKVGECNISVYINNDYGDVNGRQNEVHIACRENLLGAGTIPGTARFVAPLKTTRGCVIYCRGVAPRVSFYFRSPLNCILIRSLCWRRYKARVNNEGRNDMRNDEIGCVTREGVCSFSFRPSSASAAVLRAETLGHSSGANVGRETCPERLKFTLSGVHEIEMMKNWTHESDEELPVVGADTDTDVDAGRNHNGGHNPAGQSGTSPREELVAVGEGNDDVFYYGPVTGTGDGVTTSSVALIPGRPVTGSTSPSTSTSTSTSTSASTSAPPALPSGTEQGEPTTTPECRELFAPRPKLPSAGTGDPRSGTVLSLIHI